MSRSKTVEEQQAVPPPYRRLRRVGQVTRRGVVLAPALSRPHFGHTKSGLAVHARTIDHLAAGNPAARFNKWLAVKISRGVGTMWCAYIFAAIALYGLPRALHPGGAGIVSWIAQTFMQLVLLSVIIVGQNIQSEAADARQAKTFEDVEAVRDAQALALDRLDAVSARQETILTAITTVLPPGTPPRPQGSGETGEKLHRSR
jgi:hypothetical protein